VSIKEDLKTLQRLVTEVSERNDCIVFIFAFAISNLASGFQINKTSKIDFNEMLFMLDLTSFSP